MSGPELKWQRYRFAAAALSAAAIGLVMFAITATRAAAQSKPDEAAWAKAVDSGTVAALREYLQAFPAAAHAEEARMRIVDLTLAAPATKSDKFDGAWQTTVSCPHIGKETRGFTYAFAGQVKDGAYHGEKGSKGERGWYALDGRIDADGFGALLANGIIGASAFAAGNSPAGNPYAYHVIAQFAGKSGSGKRIEGRACNLTFVAQ